jgi:hypothetical protein
VGLGNCLLISKAHRFVSLSKLEFDIWSCPTLSQEYWGYAVSVVVSFQASQRLILDIGYASHPFVLSSLWSSLRVSIREPRRVGVQNGHIKPANQYPSVSLHLSIPRLGHEEGGLTTATTTVVTMEVDVQRRLRPTLYLLLFPMHVILSTPDSPPDSADSAPAQPWIKW